MRKRLMIIFFFFTLAGLFAQSLEFINGKSLGLRQQVITEASNYLNVPYLYGGSSFEGVDCSGLVQEVFHEAVGIDLPRTVRELTNYGKQVDNKLSGDLVFFDIEGEGPSHVGIYLGEGNFIHAASGGPQTGVIVSSLQEPYYNDRFIEIRRYLADDFNRLVVTMNENTATESLNRSLKLGSWVKLELKNLIPFQKDIITIFLNEEIYLTKMRTTETQELSEMIHLGSSGRWQIRIESGELISTIEFYVSESVF